jgi:hypothetical protein
VKEHKGTTLSDWKKLTGIHKLAKNEIGHWQ